MLFIGCDGGSTKTEWVLADARGEVLAHRKFSGCNIAYLGLQEFFSHMRKGLAELLGQAGARPDEVAGAMFGLTTYGEVEGSDVAVPAFFQRLLPAARIEVANDAVAGWAGSLACRPGVHIVAGTGSVAYARDETGREARAGGWSILFADEGSASWVGRELFKAFVRQSDGRSPRTRLYDAVRRRLGFENDILLAGFLEEKVRADSAILARMQFTALELAREGDPVAVAVYASAARELTELARALRRRLRFAKKPVAVSYYGGLFEAGDVLLEPLSRAMARAGFALQPPLYAPVVGAAGLAAQGFLEEPQKAVFLGKIAQALEP